MRKQIHNLINQYIQEIIDYQPEYEYWCDEHLKLPKSLYQSIYDGIHNEIKIENYLAKFGVDMSDYNKWYSIYLDVIEKIDIQGVIDDSNRK